MVGIVCVSLRFALLAFVYAGSGVLWLRGLLTSDSQSTQHTVSSFTNQPARRNISKSLEMSFIFFVNFQETRSTQGDTQRKKNAAAVSSFVCIASFQLTCRRRQVPPSANGISVKLISIMPVIWEKDFSDNNAH